MNAFATNLNNRTPFACGSVVVLDQHGQETLLVVLVATFAADGEGPLRLSEEPEPVRLTDEHFGEPATTGIRYESVVATHKPYVDVLVNGQAYAPRGRPTGAVLARLSVAGIDKTLRVSGDRRWMADGLPSSPQPFERMPIVYERAYGGTSSAGADLRNPIGVGYAGASSSDPLVRTELPNVEDPRTLVTGRRTAARAAGFSTLGRGWAPRVGFAGTYDKAWQDTRWPLFPEDFDSRYNQSAPLDQQCNTLSGGEEAVLTNMTPSGLWRFRVPRIIAPIHLLFDDRQEIHHIRTDTMLIEPDDYRVTLTARFALKTVRNRGRIREVAIGHVRSGWLRAIAHRKRYYGSDGTDRRRQTFEL